MKGYRNVDYYLELFEAPSRAATSETKRRYGLGFNEMLVSYRDGKCDWLVSDEEAEEIAGLFLKKCESAGFVAGITADTASRWRKLDDYLKTLEPPTTLATSVLGDKMREHHDLLTYFYGVAAVPVIVDLEEDVLAGKLLRLLALAGFESPQEALALLTTPSEPSQQKVFERDVAAVRLGEATAQEIFEKHLGLFFNGKETVNSSPEQVAREAAALSLEEAEARKNLEASKAFEELEERLSPRERVVFENARELMHQKFLRKPWVMRFLYSIHEHAAEYARRLRVEERFLRMAFSTEFPNPPKIEKLEARWRCGNFVSENGCFEETRENRGFELAAALKSELKGTCAFPGFAKGAVKIVNSQAENSKVQQGDVLVSEVTFPELVTAMKRAAAIVTDRGGLTCHAAIVAREFKIPCVVGTRFATRAFKDGDFVEVDAGAGTIKKIS